MSIKLINTNCLYNKEFNETIIYGYYKYKIFNCILINNLEYSLVFCENTNQNIFYIKIKGNINYIDNIIFYNNKLNIKQDEINNIILSFPFEKTIDLDKNSAIIITMCRNYSHRLDEWIQYNIFLGFSLIIIFNNDENNYNQVNESFEYAIYTNSTQEICNKYNNNVIIINFPYSTFQDQHWNTLQVLVFNIGIQAFKNKCRNIALIDADEFIYIVKNPSLNINKFLDKYNCTILIKSNILTNINNNDLINNNILQLAKYVGEDKYNKIILFTDQVLYLEFIDGIHYFHTQQILNKDEIIHYHCWINERCNYDKSMIKIDLLTNLFLPYYLLQTIF